MKLSEFKKSRISSDFFFVSYHQQSQPFTRTLILHLQLNCYVFLREEAKKIDANLGIPKLRFRWTNSWQMTFLRFQNIAVLSVRLSRAERLFTPYSRPPSFATPPTLPALAPFLRSWRHQLHQSCLTRPRWEGGANQGG